MKNEKLKMEVLLIGKISPFSRDDSCNPSKLFNFQFQICNIHNFTLYTFNFQFPFFRALMKTLSGAG
jgi:hypothetical protein